MLMKTEISGIFSNDDGDVNDNGKKSNSARASRFFVRFFAVTARIPYDVKMPNFTSTGGREHKTTTFLFYS